MDRINSLDFRYSLNEVMNCNTIFNPEKLVDCLRLLSTPKSLSTLALLLQSDPATILNLIVNINQIETKLIELDLNQYYVLKRKLNWLDEKLIKTYLNEYSLHKYKLKILSTIPSTNTYIMNNIDVLDTNTVVTTEYQWNGRGRLDKKWTGRIATDLAVSILYLLPKNLSFELLPLVVAVGMSRFWKHFGINNLIKWPNDILLPDGDKITGILQETTTQNNSQKKYVIIGIGLNNIRYIERNLLLSILIFKIDEIISEFIQYGFLPIRQELLDNCIHYNSMVDIYQQDRLIDSGVNLDIAKDGALIIKSNYYNEIKKYSNVSLRFK